MRPVVNGSVLLFILALGCGGCLPRVISADGTCRVVSPESVSSTTQPNAKVGRFVVVTYWHNLQKNGSPPSIDLVSAFACESPEFQISLPARFYSVDLEITEAVGFWKRYCAPEPGVMVFADNCWPAFNEFENLVDPNFSPDPKAPKMKGLVFVVCLTPATGAPECGCPTSEYTWERGGFPPVVFKLDSLKWHLATGRGITDADRVMVYRQLEKQIQAWEDLKEKGDIKAESAKLQGAHGELVKLITALERKAQKN